jgi:MSHA pilin protein MshC
MRGFTLVELIMVIVLLGILSFVAAGRMANRDDFDVQGFAEQVATTVRLAQKSAVAQRRTVYVNVDVGAGLVRACLDALVACNSPLPAPFGGDLAVTAPGSVTLASGENQFSFDPMGRPSLGATLEIVAMAGNGAAYSVFIERESGYVRTVPGAVTLGSAENQFFFDLIGRPSLGATLEIVATAGNGASYRVIVEQESGYVHTAI